MAKRLGLVFLVAAAGACSDENLGKVNPEIVISLDSLQFGEVPVNTVRTKEILLAAASRVEVKIVRLEVTGADAAFFTLPAEIAGAIPAESTLSLEVAFRPTEERDYVATLVVETDDPDTADSPREIALFGVGKSPNIAVEPAHGFIVADGVTDEISAIRCPDGKTYPRCTTRRSLRIINSGDVELEVTKVSWAEVTPGILSGSPPAPPGLSFLGSISASTIRERSSVNVGLEFRPTSTTPDEYDVKIRIESNDPDTPVLEVPVHVRIVPNSPPTACAKVQKVWRGQYDASGNWGFSGDIGPGPEGYGDPFDPVVRAGYLVWMYDGGTDSAPCATEDADGDDLFYRWTVTPLDGQPAPLVVGATSTNMRFEVPALGDYEVKLEVWDTLHQNNPTVDTLIVHAAPKDDITVSLDWRETGPKVFDLDLHLVRMEAPYDLATLVSRLWCGDDAYFFNREPDWGDPGSIGNPILNLDGQGLDERTRAENTTLQVAEPGEYWILVNYFKDSNGGVGADVPKEQVKVHLFTSSASGLERWPAAEGTYYSPSRDLKYPGALTGCDGGGTCLDFWLVGKVIWPGVGERVQVVPFPDGGVPAFLPKGDAYPGDLAVQSCTH